jgi:arylsulfatase A-like enzyme
MILYEPESAADATRGTANSSFVEAIDLAPSFVEAAGGPDLSHVFEGRSLLPLTRTSSVANWRNYVVSELDYSFRDARANLDIEPARARAYMFRTEYWKYVLYEDFRPQLFDLVNDPHELDDRGADPALEQVRNELHDRLFEWSRNRKSRITISESDVRARAGTARKRGIVIGEW